MERPLIPQECRIRNLTYQGDIVVDFEYKYKEFYEKKFNIRIGKIPLMVGSDYCWSVGDDSESIKGFFIIKGVEKVILMQEQMFKN